MSDVPAHIERAAKAIYSQFVAHGIGTCQWLRDDGGNIVKDRFGASVRETPAQAVERRWAQMPEASRHRFRHEAVAALEAAQVAA